MANIQLGSDKEAAALGDIERVMRTDEIEGERVRIIGYAQTEDGSHRLQAVEGVADVVTSLEIDLDESAPFATYTKEMAALCVRMVQNDTAMDYIFPNRPTSDCGSRDLARYQWCTTLHPQAAPLCR